MTLSEYRKPAPSFVQRALSGLSRGLGFSAAQIAPPAVDDPRLWGLMANNTRAGISVTSDQAIGLDVVASVLGRLSGTLSTLPLMVYERVDPNFDPDPVDESETWRSRPAPNMATADPRKPAKEHPIYKLIRRRPNRTQTAQEFWGEFTFRLALWRNAFAEIAPDPVTGDPIGALLPIHPDRVIQIQRRPANDPQGKVWYQVRALDYANSDHWVPEDRMFHVRLAPLRKDGLAGIPVFEASAETIGKAIAVEQFGALYFANGGSGGGVLMHPGSFKTTDDRDAALAAWRAGGSGLNRHKDRLLLFGMTYQPFTVKNDEAQFNETVKEQSIKLCRLWNMPPHLVGILDRATFSNIEQQSIEYVQHTIAPMVSAIEQAICRDLLIGDDQDKYFAEFNLEGLLRGDFRTRMAGYAQGRQWGWLSVNDIRARENMPTIGAAGDVYLTPLNMGDASDPDALDPDANMTGGDPDPPQDEQSDADEAGDDEPAPSKTNSRAKS